MTQPPAYRPKTIFEPLVRGPRGPRGPSGGPPGPEGPPGADGTDGVSLIWRGAWSGATAYAVNDAVSSGGSAYVCTVAHTNHVPPNASFWDLLAAKGDTGATGSPGAPGPAINWLGAWSGATAYVFGDGVSIAGSSYVCILAHTNHSPPNGTYWNLLAQAGAAGATGATGATGAAGATGARGLTWRGTWNSGTAYVADDAVESGGSSYVCILAHTNHVPPNITYWDLLAQEGLPGVDGADGLTRPAGLGAAWDGGASVLTLTGTVKVLTPPSPYNGTIAQASLTCLGGPGSATVTITRFAAGAFPGSPVDITAGADIALTSEDEHLDSTLSGWDLDVVVGDRFLFELTAVDGVIRYLDAFLTMS